MKILTVKKKELLSRGQISEEMSKARSAFSYVKFMLHNDIYITVIYNRDFTIELATNTRNLHFWKELEMLGNKKIHAMVIDFVYKWLNKLNELPKGCFK